MALFSTRITLAPKSTALFDLVYAYMDYFFKDSLQCSNNEFPIIFSLEGYSEKRKTIFDSANIFLFTPSPSLCVPNNCGKPAINTLFEELFSFDRKNLTLKLWIRPRPFLRDKLNGDNYTTKT